jgi:fructose-1,6-bisphosphatase I
MVSVAAAATTATRSPSHLLFSSSRSLSPFQQCVFDSKTLVSCPNNSNSKKKHVAAGVRCMAVGTTEAGAKKKKGAFEIETLTNWLLKQEQAGVIDAELTIVLSSISMACKQIASLVQRASISNLTGIQGAVNIQGEDQKKLDVVSNEVCIASFFFFSLSLSLSFFSFFSFFFFKIKKKKRKKKKSNIMGKRATKNAKCKASNVKIKITIEL